MQHSGKFSIKKSILNPKLIIQDCVPIRHYFLGFCQCCHIHSNYSSEPQAHLRHDILHKGICVTKRCNVSEEHSKNVTYDKKIVESFLTKCMTRELEEAYQLEGNVSVRYCEDKVYSRSFNIFDWVYVAIILGIVIMNGIGTVYDVWRKKREIKLENRFLLSFSIISNWRRNMTFESISNRKKTFKPIDGLRFFLICCLLFVHLPIINVTYIDNAIKIDSIRGMEGTINITLLIQLTPVYAVVLGFLCTLYDYMGSGPLWQDNIVIEADACRQLWWTHFIYINNYLDVPTACYDITWYLAADMQLFCYGTLVMMIIWKFPSLSRYFFGLLIIIAIIVPGLQTYIFNYYPIIPPYSERTLNHFKNNPTFTNIYATVSGNLFGSTIGITAGYLHYYMEKKDISLAKIKAFKQQQFWFRILFYISWPMLFCIVLSGRLFINFVYDPIIAGVYVSLHRPLFAFFAMTFILGAIHKCYNISRGFLEWDGFQLLSKFTYCVYLTHFMIQRYSSGFTHLPYHISSFNAVSKFLIIFARNLAIKRYKRNGAYKRLHGTLCARHNEKRLKTEYVGEKCDKVVLAFKNKKIQEATKKEEERNKTENILTVSED
ncbi:uncharacterized protein LOC143913112 [Arctopsyche grandis]|uniref:uncharacterized protein LOC143913112 n=1 Tax=Arctopsyche grandis TaxID=121162 RepID=UPI00406DA155